ncbi:MAG TPA: elongation factor EF-2 [Candidatus Thermoplasmatota archaeon]|nr:elongation factor EF-2 [Candidatus Thermoplasmatota archaeon]
MGRKEDNIAKARELMHQPEFIRNIGTAAHIDHGKTTFSDNLIAGAGMMSEDLAGKQLVLDFDEQEAARGITINAAAASMVHDYGGKQYLVNLIDTPGHVDFGGDVTRAMRAIDGAFILVCAVEEVMPQTETVIRQALREKVRPILYINKVDRLINEVKLTPEQMMAKFQKIITEVNGLMLKQMPPEFKEKWALSVEKGTVAFGSAYHNWAISAPWVKKSGVNFKQVFEYLQAGNQKELAKKAPIAQVMLDLSITHHPPPHAAQKYRIPHIWKGDLASDMGKSLVETNEKGPVAFMVTKIIVDPHAGEVAVGRVFSGSIRKGQKLFVSGMPNANTVQSVGLLVGADRIPTEEVTAGNIAAVVGLKDAIAGSTVTEVQEMEPFEKIVHYSEPVVTKAIEAKHTRDLPKLVEVMRTVAKADPSIQVEINQETGEHLMSGMGELHLEITEYRIVNEHKVEISTSPPIVVYRECVQKRSPAAFEGKSPNKHNKFYVIAEPLEESFVKAIKEGEIPEGKVKNIKDLVPRLVELGWEKDRAKGLIAVQGTNMLLDVTKGIQYLHETRELILEAFKEAMTKGPLAGEPVAGVKLLLVDAKLHEDAVHRGPAQSIPAMRNAIYGSMVTAGRTILEPKQKIFVNVPQDVMGPVTREIQQRRGVIENMEQEGDLTIIHCKAPVAELFGFASAIRGAAQGRCLWSTEHAGFEMLPRELLDKTVGEIRKRKGLPEKPYEADYYAG